MKQFSPRPSGHRPGLAVVVVVSLTAMLTLLVVAFLLLSSTHRGSSSNDVAARQAKSIAETASEVLISSLVAEMREGSTVTTIGSGEDKKELFRIDDPKKMLPERSTKDSLAAPEWDGKMWSNSDTLNLIKQSAREKEFFAGGPVLASDVNTASSRSIDGRSFAAVLWSQPRLFTPQYELPADSTPDWVYLTRDGSKPTVFTPANKTSVPPSGIPEPAYVVGRFAYQIYNVGGLLDMNAAGYNPTGTKTEVIGGKGSLLLADLRAIPGLNGSTTVADVVSWRNKGDGSDLTEQINFSRRNGWMRPYNGSNRSDNFFLNRADLIRFLEDKLGEDDARLALPYLSSFTRSFDRPSFQPSPNRPKIKFGANQGGNNAIGLDDNVNPGARSQANGTLLAKKRFALENIDLLKNPSGNATRIEKLFGLTRSGNVWTYEHGRSDDITPIGSTDMGSRKGTPDFFETLKAAIHVGSLGVQHGTDNSELQSALAASGLAGTYAHRLGGIDSDVNYQILKIGANLIDQWDEDSYPTVIEFNGETISGNESLPYITATMNYLYAEQVFNPGVATGFRLVPNWTGPVQFVNLLTPRLWNPYVRATNNQAEIPTQFRVRGEYVGQDMVTWVRHGNNNKSFENNTHPWNNSRADAGPPPGWNGNATAFANRWNYKPIGGENYGPGETDNPATTLNGCEVDFTLSGNWSSSWPYPFSDPRMLYRSEYPTSAVTVSAGAGSVRFSSIHPHAKAGFNEENRSYSSFAASYEVYGFPLGRGWQGPNAAAIDDDNNSIADVPPAKVDGDLNGTPKTTSFFAVADRPTSGVLKLTLSCQDASGAWLPYDVTYVSTSGFDGFVHNAAGTGGNVVDTINKQQTDCWLRLDPRSNRGGMLFADSHPNMVAQESNRTAFWSSREWREGRTLRFGAAGGLIPDPQALEQLPSSNQLWNITENKYGTTLDRTDPSGVFYNTSASAYRYVDPDGIQRRGMGAYWTEGSLEGQPMASSDPDGTYPFSANSDVRANRPVMLNRAFRSIAEMGVVFRDSPWRNLDFFTVESGDAALLDFFCLNSKEDADDKSLVPTSKEGSPIIAGKISLNSPHPEVISAAIRGVAREMNSLDNGDPFTSESEVDKISQGLVDYVHSKSDGRPMRNPSELVGHPVSATEYEGFAETLSDLLSDSKDQKIQQRHEAVIRALADSGEGATWNLMIDLVAQSGKLTPAATGLKDFIVEGQKRYWVHVALDRTTGEIIDQQWEPAYE
jgi:hypothetical protein